MQPAGQFNRGAKPQRRHMRHVQRAAAPVFCTAFGTGLRDMTKGIRAGVRHTPVKEGVRIGGTADTD